MLNLRCRTCDAPVGLPVFSSNIFFRQVKYFECRNCGYVQTQDPDWLDRAYSSAINNSDTGIMVRNQANVGIVLATLSCIGRLNGCVVDYAGGYGILVRLLRDRGVDALWSDPYCKNLLALGFAHRHEKAELVTAFEAFEHFVNPLCEAEKLFAVAPNLLISTELIATPTPDPNQWWYYGLDHGQHIGFFRRQTLHFIAKRFNKHLISDGKSYHLFTQDPVATIRWQFYTRLAKHLPALFSWGLKSKVWSDFEKMSNFK